MSDVFEICSESFSVCGVVCVLIACLLDFSFWRLVVLDVYVTLLRMRGPHDDVRLYVPGLCPLVVSVVSGLAVLV